MKIKICGIFREQDIDYINEARPDYCGFVFAESKRQVSPAQAARLRQRLAEGIAAVGVFVNAPIENIIALYRDGTINIAQLHGDEDETYIVELKDASAKSGKEPNPIIKVIKSEIFNTLSRRHGGHGDHGEYKKNYKKPCPQQQTAPRSGVDVQIQHVVAPTKSTVCIQKRESFSFRSGRPCPPCLREMYSKVNNADYYLFDSGAGSGETFDWGLLNSLNIEKPWFLAGGINLDNIGQAMAINPFGIDVSSGVETGGVKDREKILQLVATIRKGKTI
jgi:phosphoribosylanthranilate isomerase